MGSRSTALSRSSSPTSFLVPLMLKPETSQLLLAAPVKFRSIGRGTSVFEAMPSFEAMPRNFSVLATLSIEESSRLSQLVEKALTCKACLAEVVDFALTYHDEDLSIVVEKLSIAMKAIEVAGVFDHQGSCNFELALARNSWRVRANKLFGGPQKPLIQQIQRHLKEGLAIRVPPEYHFWQKLGEVKHICTQWAEKAKKVSTDCGTLGLENVFELIYGG